MSELLADNATFVLIVGLRGGIVQGGNIQVFDSEAVGG